VIIQQIITSGQLVEVASFLIHDNIWMNESSVEVKTYNIADCCHNSW
jgi:hypothetical protein